jgi:hypothetical protein
MKRRAPVGAGDAARDIRNGFDCPELIPPRLDFQRSCMHLHRTGPQVLAEFLRELIGPCRDLEVDAKILFDRYGRLTRNELRGVGGSDWPLPLQHLVGGRDDGD